MLTLLNKQHTDDSEAALKAGGKEVVICNSKPYNVGLTWCCPSQQVQDSPDPEKRLSLAEYSIEVGNELAVESVNEQTGFSLVPRMQWEEWGVLWVGSIVFQELVADDGLIHAHKSISIVPVR